MLSYVLYLVYLYPRLGLDLFMSYLCNLFFIFSLIFIFINDITLYKKTHLLYVHFSDDLLIFLDDIVHEKNK